MEHVKPAVDRDEAIAAIEQSLGATVTQFDDVAGGSVAQTYGFTANGREYIVRFNWQMGANFEKEAWIAQTFAAAGVPIPRIVQLGHLGDLRFAISDKAPGVRHDLLAPDEAAALMPSLLRTLDAIHTIDVSATAGYGIIDDAGTGMFPSWRESLMAVAAEEPEWDYHGKWHTLFETSFLERDVFERLFARMTELLPHCPEERWLVHGNYGYGNVLADSGEVTAVLDWIDAKYGDYLFDVAWLDFWRPTANWAAQVLVHYTNNGVTIPSFHERLQCYACSIGMDALKFFAKGGNEPAYTWTKQHVQSLIDART